MAEGGIVILNSKEQPWFRTHRKENTEVLLRMLEEKYITVDSATCEVTGKSGKLLKVSPTFWGYPRVVIFYMGKAWSFYLHKIIWVSVHGAVPVGFEIDHKGSKNKPSIDTLQLLSWEENLAKNKKEKKEEAF